VKLKLTNGDDHRAVLSIDDDREKMVLVRCQELVAVAKEIAKRSTAISCSMTWSRR
jgi:hypothetical protein